jgi:two-component system LytT family sensor kinase
VRRLRYFTIAVLIASVPVALMALASREPRRPDGVVVPLSAVLPEAAAIWYPWVLVAPVIDREVRRQRPGEWRGRLFALVRHAGILAAFTIAHGSLMFALERGSEEPPVPLARAVRAETIPDGLLYLAVAGGFTIAESRRRHTEIAGRLRAEVAEARLDALRQQLNPHFLFNTLNHIVMQLRQRDVEPAERMLLALSDLLRDVLHERAQLIPLRDELRMVERYLEIERGRFGDRLDVEVTFDPRALDARVPSLMLQPLLENAMRHGVSAVDGRCRVMLAIRRVGARLTIDIRDAGPGLDVAPMPAGVGLTNTAERLKYLYGADHRFTLSAPDGGGLLVAIDLPFRRT